MLARNAFEQLGYRRVEWKCDSLNAGSRRAAERFGFTFEGVFEQHMVIKGRNRDTAWYAITDNRWPAVRAAFEGWLAPSNFDEEGGSGGGCARCAAADGTPGCTGGEPWSHFRNTWSRQPNDKKASEGNSA